MADMVNPGGDMNVRGQSQAAVTPRPGLVTFAAVMMFLFAGFQILYAIEEFAAAAWVAANVNGTVGGPLWVWGIIDLAFAVLAIYAGYGLLRGDAYGQIAALIVATFSAIRWFFYIPAAPWTALVMILVDVLIIYVLATRVDYFRSPRAPTPTVS